MIARSIVQLDEVTRARVAGRKVNRQKQL